MVTGRGSVDVDMTADEHIAHLRSGWRCQSLRNGLDALLLALFLLW